MGQAGLGRFRRKAVPPGGFVQLPADFVFWAIPDRFTKLIADDSEARQPEEFSAFPKRDSEKLIPVSPIDTAIEECSGLIACVNIGMERP